MAERMGCWLILSRVWLASFWMPIRRDQVHSSSSDSASILSILIDQFPLLATLSPYTSKGILSNIYVFPMGGYRPNILPSVSFVCYWQLPIPYLKFVLFQKRAHKETSFEITSCNPIDQFSGALLTSLHDSELRFFFYYQTSISPLPFWV